MTGCSSVSTDTKVQIASLLRTGNQRITLKIQKVQVQKGASVCDAYAIAFATDLAYGNNPASREYEQSYGHVFLYACQKNRLYHFHRSQ